MFNDYPEWSKEWAKKRFYENKNKNKQKYINDIRDWLYSLDDKMQNKLYKITWEQAIEHQKKWHLLLASKTKKIKNFEGRPDDILKIEECHDYNWVEITTAEGLDFEGNAMGHCVGNGYYDSFKNIIYSLRDKNNFPHITLEFDSKNKKLIQIKGKGNQEPNIKYYQHIASLFNFIKPLNADGFSFYLLSDNKQYYLCDNLNDFLQTYKQDELNIYTRVKSIYINIKDFPQNVNFYSDLLIQESDIETIKSKNIKAHYLGIEKYAIVKEYNEKSWINKIYYCISNYQNTKDIKLNEETITHESFWLLMDKDKVSIRLFYNNQTKTIKRILGHQGDIKYGEDIAWLFNQLEINFVEDFSNLMFIKEENKKIEFILRENIRTYMKDKNNCHIYGLLTSVDNGKKEPMFFPDNITIHGDLDIIYYDLFNFRDKNITIFGNVSIKKCTNNEQISFNHNSKIKNIIIDRCHEIININRLNAENISILNCEKLHSIQMLISNILTIRNCPKLKIINKIDVIDTINISGNKILIIENSIRCKDITMQNMTIPKCFADTITLKDCSYTSGSISAKNIIEYNNNNKKTYFQKILSLFKIS
jgi:hypothetical protein